jgi:hypothetical protein
VSYTYYNSTRDYYVSDTALDDSGVGLNDSPLKTVGGALTKIRVAYGLAWPGKPADPLAVRLHIKGTITENVDITDSGLYATLPPVILEGWDASNPGIIDANYSGRPLTINKAAVILGDGLTLTKGQNDPSADGGVFVGANGSFTMSGGTISGNRSGGVFVSASTGSFTMNGGTISGNSDGNGGGVYVAGGVFSMNGGSINTNTASVNGAGVYVTDDSGVNGRFTMTGGSIKGNTANSSGGGVYVDTSGGFEMTGGTIGGSVPADANISGSGGGVYVNGGAFTMNDGTISLNAANSYVSGGNGGGVYLSSGSFTMNGGTISGNTARNNAFTGRGKGGGVYLSDGSFAMGDGIISGNTASGSIGGRGGGVYVEESSSSSFTMSGESHVNGNIATGDGGGVCVTGSGNSFTIEDQSRVNGNIATGGGGGVFVYNGAIFTMRDQSSIGVNNADGGGGVYVAGDSSAFTMWGGTISGNKALSYGTNYGGGVLVVGNGAFTMWGGTISGNSAANSVGGGVALFNGLTFDMNGGEIRENYAGLGGGVCNANSTFTMKGGTISGNTTPSAKSAGVYMYAVGATFNMKQLYTSIDDNNDVWLAPGTTINIEDSMVPGMVGFMARITPQDYRADTVVLTGYNVSSYYRYFTVTPDNTTNWTIDSGGLLQLPP